MFSSSSRLPQRWQLLPLIEATSGVLSFYVTFQTPLQSSPPASWQESLLHHCCVRPISPRRHRKPGVANIQYPDSEVAWVSSLGILMHFRGNGAICQRGRLSLEKDMHGGVCDFRNSSHPWPCSFPASLCPSRSRVLSCCPPQTNSTREISH